MKLIPVEISMPNDESNLVDIPKTIDVTMTVRFIGHGDFSEFVTNNKLNMDNLILFHSKVTKYTK
jgi:hypothetical protein